MSVLRGLLFDNLGVKLAALLLAIVVYLHVYTERPATMVVSFPLQLTDLPDSLVISNRPLQPVQAELRGTGKQLIRLRLTEPRIKVSLAGVEPGRFERVVTIEDLPLMASDRLEVVRLVGPRTIGFEIEPRIGRRLPVAVRVTGTPHSGSLWSGDVIVDPTSVLVRGPRSAVLRLDSVRVAAVRIDARRDTVRAEVMPDSLPAGATSEPPLVNVTIPIVRRGP